MGNTKSSDYSSKPNSSDNIDFQKPVSIVVGTNLPGYVLTNIIKSMNRQSKKRLFMKYFINMKSVISSGNSTVIKVKYYNGEQLRDQKNTFKIFRKKLKASIIQTFNGRNVIVKNESAVLRVLEVQITQ